MSCIHRLFALQLSNENGRSNDMCIPFDGNNLQLSNIGNGGENMVQAQYSETFLKGEDIISLGITKLKILDEGSYVKGNFGEQLQVRVLANDKDKKKFKWSLNNDSNDTLIHSFGKDTAEWVGKEIEVTTKINKAGKPGISVKPQGKQGGL